MPTPFTPILVSIPGDIDPMEREERFAGPIGRALRAAGRLGRVVGGGTSMSLGGPRFVSACYIDLDVTDLARAVSVLRRVLRDLGAPRGTRVIHCETEEVLLAASAPGVVQAPKRQSAPPEYPWAEGEILGYRLAPRKVAVLYVVQAGRHPMFRVLGTCGPTVPGDAEVRELLMRRERRYTLREHFHAIGWSPLGLRCVLRMPGRLVADRVERPGLVVPFAQRYLKGRFCAFDSWPGFDQFLRKLWGAAPATGTERMYYDLGVGSLAHHLAVWDARRPVSAEQAYELLAAYVRNERDQRTIAPTAALEQFVRDLKARFAGLDDPWMGSFRAAEGFMIVPVANRWADEVRAVARTLAIQHDLTLYDPHLEMVIVQQGAPV
jgi:hypothetical protein